MSLYRNLINSYTGSHILVVMLFFSHFCQNLNEYTIKKRLKMIMLSVSVHKSPITYFYANFNSNT